MMRSVTHFRRFTAVALLCLGCASCTGLQLHGYRDAQCEQQCHYALGEKYIDAGGLRYCYQETGRGPNVLIFPGLATSIDFWQQNIPVLAEHYHVVAVDPPGFGKSEKPDACYHLCWTVERLVSFMDAIHLDHATIIGGSLGGQFGLMIAIAHPERVDKLVLMGSSGAWDPTGPIADLLIRLLWTDWAVTEHMRNHWPHIFHTIVHSDTPLTRHLLRCQMAVRADRSLFVNEGRASSRALRSIFYTQCRPDIPNVHMPVLLVWGENDVMHLLSEGIYFRDHLPDARLVVVPHTAHEVMLDEPEIFNRLVLTFLQSGTRDIQNTPLCRRGGKWRVQSN